MHSVKFSIRPLKQSESGCLSEFLYLAIFVPPGVPAPPFEIVNEPELAIYIRDFGTLPGDRCLVAVRDDPGIADAEKIIGAVWTRIINDYGHLDDETPSFSISVRAPYRGLGIGTALMEAMVERLKADGFKTASLSVQKINPAVKLYNRLGFETVRENRDDLVMRIDLG